MIGLIRQGDMWSSWKWLVKTHLHILYWTCQQRGLDIPYKPPWCQSLPDLACLDKIVKAGHVWPRSFHFEWSSSPIGFNTSKGNNSRCRQMLTYLYEAPRRSHWNALIWYRVCCSLKTELWSLLAKWSCPKSLIHWWNLTNSQWMIWEQICLIEQ